MKHYHLTILFLFVLSACQTNPKSEKTPADYTVSLNEEFTIDLMANPSTGYTWKLSNASTLTKVVANGDKYIPSIQKKNIVGSGGIQKLRFKAIKKGVEVLTFVYIRPWERGAQPAQKKTIEVEIR